MTMDMHVRTSATHSGTTSRRPCSTSSTPVTINLLPSTPSFSPNLPTSSLPTRNIKRSFDVAFLMAPDEKLAKKQLQQQQQQQQHQDRLRVVSTGALLSKPHSQLSSSDHGVYLQHYRSTPRVNVQSDNESPRNFSQKIPEKRSFSPEVVVPKYDEAFLERVKLHNGMKHHQEGLLQTFDEAERMSRSGFKHLELLHHVAGQRSAFTKVTTSSKYDVSSSPASLSPDHLNYQDSLSPANHSSPSQYNAVGDVTGSQSGRSNHSSPFLTQGEVNGKHIKAGNQIAIPSIASSEGYRNATVNGSFRSIDSYLLKSNSNQFYNHLPSEKDLMSSNFINSNVNKIRSNMLYHHQEAVAYSTLAAAYPFAANFPSPSGDMLRPGLLHAASNPAVAAAVVSASLLPSSFAAFSLPAQNVCAKCNISFRMTSDLVYHMRSHHKGDNVSADPGRRRRDQDKLKCPVCSESFRERHHLTRHMTAHQDKAGDVLDQEEEGEGSEGGRRRMQGMVGQTVGK